MTLSFSPYELTPLTPNGESRRGFIVCLSGGYADLHSWPSLGQPPVIELQQELKRFAEGGMERGRMHTISQQALKVAEQDKAARESGTRLCDGISRIKNHYSFGTLRNDGAARDTLKDARSKGFSRIKCKLSLSPIECAESFTALNDCDAATDLLFRLDPNARWNLEQIRSFLKALSKPLLSRIEFIEDPCPFSTKNWRALKDDFGVSLAADFELPGDPTAHSLESFDWIVWKPAYQPITSHLSELMIAKRNIVVTSNLAHPLEQISSAAQAIALYEELSLEPQVCGLFSHTAYKATDFSEELDSNGSALSEPQGFGFGFDPQLASLSFSS